MCTSTIVAFVVSIIEGLAGGILGNYRLNDLKEKHNGITHNNQEDEQLLPNSYNSLRTRALKGFDENDSVYEQFSVSPEMFDAINDNENIESANTIKEDCVDYSWKSYRELQWIIWLRTCILHSFYIVVLCGFFISIVVVTIMFVDINTAEVCFFTKWNLLPKSVQRLHVTVQVFEGWILQFLHIFTMIFVFGLDFVDRLHLIGLNIGAAFLDSVFRLFLQVYDIYDVSWKTYPLNFIFVGITIFNSYIISRHFYRCCKLKALLTFKLGSHLVMGALTIYMNNYLLIPWFVTLEPISQAIVAAGAPIFGAIIKSISRISVQNLYNINHPGTSYVLILPAYAASALVYRTLQAEIQSFQLYTLLCMIHGFVGLLERLSVVLRDHFYVWFYKKVLKREPHFKSFIGSFRSTRTQRLVADLVICNIIHEITSLIYTNAFVQLYALQFSKTDNWKILKQFFIRTFVAVSAEYFFTIFGIFILTWHMNVPVIKVWKKKWKSLLFTNTLVCSILAIYVTHYLTQVISVKYEHIYKNDTVACNTSDLLFFS